MSGPEPKPDLPGDSRTFRVWLDPNQYQQDMAATMQGHEVGPCSTLHTPTSCWLIYPYSPQQRNNLNEI